MGNLFSGSADSKPTVADTVDVDSADSDSDSDSTDDDFADAVDVDQVFTDTTSVDSATHDNAEDVPGNVIYETRFHVDGRLCIVTRSNILDYPCDVIGNSVSTKDTPNENVLDCSGILAEQIAEMGGQSLVDELASPKHKCWSWGEIRFTGSHDLYRNDSSPKHFCHFCVPLSYEGDTTYLILERICASTLNLYQPMGLGFKEVVAAASDYSDPEKAFRKSIGVDRNTTDIAVTVLPVERGARIKKYEIEVQKVKSLRTELNGKVESYGWHGTTGDAANSIKKNGFDISMVTTHYYGKGAYFATTADSAHAYAVPNSQHVPDGLKETVKKQNGTFTMLLCKIVTGMSHFGRETMTKPDKGYDSARNKYGSYMVIFNADAILPLAIIEYTIQRKE